MLREIESDAAGLTVAELARRLELQPGVVEEMLAFWSRKGRVTVLMPADMTACRDRCVAGCRAGAACGMSAVAVTERVSGRDER